MLLKFLDIHLGIRIAAMEEQPRSFVDRAAYTSHVLCASAVVLPVRKQETSNRNISNAANPCPQKVV